MIAVGPARPYSLAEAYAYCQRLATTYPENFRLASWLLPRTLRPHLYAVYAYCRGVDHLGDEAEGDRLALLDDWEAELRRCFDGTPRHPTFVALKETIRRFDIPQELFQRPIETIDYDVLHRRAKLSRARKAWLTVRGLLPPPVPVRGGC